MLHSSNIIPILLPRTKALTKLLAFSNRALCAHFSCVLCMFCYCGGRSVFLSSLSSFHHFAFFAPSNWILMPPYGIFRYISFFFPNQIVQRIVQVVAPRLSGAKYKTCKYRMCQEERRSFFIVGIVVV